MKKIFLIGLFIIVFTSLIGAFQYLKYEDGLLHVYVCDVGQGDGILIRTPASNEILIDGGPDSKILGCLEQAMPFWDRQLEAVIATHPDADHFGGLIDVIKRYRVSKFYTNGGKADTKIWQALQEELAVKKMSASFLERGREFDEKGGLRLKILWPEQNLSGESDQNIANQNRNDASIVARLTYGDFSALFTGDAEAPILENILPDLKNTDLLKVSHHGSKIAVSNSLLQTMNPSVAVISVGKNNRYGHPTRTALDLLNKDNIKIERTDLSGTREFISNGRKWWER